MKQKSPAVTLIELLIAIMLIGVIIIAIANIEVFSRFHVTAADRRTKLQNEISFALDHMNKRITNAIGYSTNWAVLREPYAGGERIRVRIDSNGNGKVDPTPTDTWIAYRHENLGTTDSVIRFYPTIASTSNEIISHKILLDSGVVVKGVEFIGNFNPTTNYLEDNVLEVKITARWQPDQPATQDNPEVTMRSKIYMPSVSSIKPGL